MLPKIFHKFIKILKVILIRKKIKSLINYIITFSFKLCLDICKT